MKALCCDANQTLVFQRLHASHRAFPISASAPKAGQACLRVAPSVAPPLQKRLPIASAAMRAPASKRARASADSTPTPGWSSVMQADGMHQSASSLSCATSLAGSGPPLREMAGLLRAGDGSATNCTSAAIQARRDGSCSNRRAAPASPWSRRHHCRDRHPRRPRRDPLRRRSTRRRARAEGFSFVMSATATTTSASSSDDSMSV